MEQIKRLRQAFPQIPPGFTDILLDRIKDRGFTDDRLRDSINNLIDNFTYPVPSVANIVSFDKRIKLYTYAEYCDQISAGFKSTDFSMVKRNGKNFWITVADKEIYNIGKEI
jgi:hypothetical protein